MTLTETQDTDWEIEFASHFSALTDSAKQIPRHVWEGDNRNFGQVIDLLQQARHLLDGIAAESRLSPNPDRPGGNASGAESDCSVKSQDSCFIEEEGERQRGQEPLQEAPLHAQDTMCAAPSEAAGRSESPPESLEPMDDATQRKLQDINTSVSQYSSQLRELEGEAEAFCKESHKEKEEEDLLKAEGLEKGLLCLSEGLMTAMLALDQVESSHSGARAQRKQQIREIQANLDLVDGLSQKVQSEKATFEGKAAAIRQMKDEEKKSREAKGLLVEYRKCCEQWHDKQRWAELQIKPEFDLTEGPEAYTLSAQLSGQDGWMKESVRVDLTEAEDALVICGQNVPNPRVIREVLMEGERQIEAQIERNDGKNTFTVENVHELIPNLIAGKFGQFTRRFPVPADVDVNGIGASFENNFLAVTLPRLRTTAGRGGMRGAMNEDFLKPLGGMLRDFGNPFSRQSGPAPAGSGPADPGSRPVDTGSSRPTMGEGRQTGRVPRAGATPRDPYGRHGGTSSRSGPSSPPPRTAAAMSRSYGGPGTGAKGATSPTPGEWPPGLRNSGAAPTPTGGGARWNTGQRTFY